MNCKTFRKYSSQKGVILLPLILGVITILVVTFMITKATRLSPVIEVDEADTVNTSSEITPTVVVTNENIKAVIESLESIPADPPGLEIDTEINSLESIE